VRMSRGQPTMPWSDGLCQGQRYPSHREGGWIVIAVWLTLDSSADGAGILERLGHRRPVGTGSGYRPASRKHPDEQRPQRPILLAVDQEFGEGATLRVPRSRRLLKGRPGPTSSPGPDPFSRPLTPGCR
jgi:hypothetical protein